MIEHDTVLAYFVFQWQKSTVDERFRGWITQKKMALVTCFSQTFAIVQVHVDRLALTEGAESNHVFVRVE